VNNLPDYSNFQKS